MEHAGGAGSTRPGGLSEIDPERNLNGELIEGEHPGRSDGDFHPERRNVGEVRAREDEAPVGQVAGESDRSDGPRDLLDRHSVGQDEKDEDEKDGEKPSLGSSSAASSAKRETSAKKK